MGGGKLSINRELIVKIALGANEQHRPIFVTRASLKRSFVQSQVLNTGELQTSRWRPQPSSQKQTSDLKDSVQSNSQN